MKFKVIKKDFKSFLFLIKFVIFNKLILSFPCESNKPGVSIIYTFLLLNIPSFPIASLVSDSTSLLSLNIFSLFINVFDIVDLPLPVKPITAIDAIILFLFYF